MGAVYLVVAQLLCNSERQYKQRSTLLKHTEQYMWGSNGGNLTRVWSWVMA